MKKIEYKKEGSKMIHTTKRGNKNLIWMDGNRWYVWIAPVGKLWQSKKYRRSEVELVEI